MNYRGQGHSFKIGGVGGKHMFLNVVNQCSLHYCTALKKNRWRLKELD